MASNIIEIIIRAKDMASDVIKKTGMTAEQFGKKMTSVGLGLTAGVTLPLAAAGAASIKLASDYEESLNKVKVVFGEASGAIEDFSKDAAKNLGLSRQEALAAAGTFGNLFTAMGIGVDTSSDMSKELLTLAADLASFNNISTTDALDKLRAGLVGEAEPLRSLGVNINQATIETKAMELGLISAGQELSAAAKAQATYALILEQTTSAQGDFARTSDGLANSTRILQAELKDAGAQLGEKLLPIALQLVQGLNSLVTAFTSLPAPVQNTILVLAGIAAAAGPVITAIGGIITAVTTITGLFGAGGALAGVGAAISGAGTAISTTLIPALLAAAAPIALLVVAVGALIAVWNVFGADAMKTVETIGKIFEALPTLIKIKLGEAGEAIKANAPIMWQNLKTGFKETMTEIDTGFQAAQVSISERMVEATKSVIDFGYSAKTSISEALQSVSSSVQSWSIVQAFQARFQAVMNIAREFAKQVIQFFYDLGKKISDTINSAISSAQNALSGATGGLIPESTSAATTSGTSSGGSLFQDLFGDLFGSTSVPGAGTTTAPAASTQFSQPSSAAPASTQPTKLTVNLGNQTLGSFIVDYVNQAVAVG